jgi:hypothetical protein
MAALLASLVLVSCGTTKTIYVVYPSHPITLCVKGRFPRTATLSRSCPASAFDARRLLGLNVSQAEALAHKYGDELLVTVRDGKSVPVTTEFASNRIDVIVIDGEITHVIGFG